MRTLTILLALMSFFIASLGSPVGGACKEGTLKCGGGNPGGAVFACRKGSWEVFMDCGPSESCREGIVPHCTWALADTDSTGASHISGFEIQSAEVSAATNAQDNANSKAPTTGPGESSSDSPYYNICSPCIRSNDNCKEDCAWQGKACDTLCNWQTCSVNLTTGDFRQPSVSCGQFCKWPCQ